MAFVSDTFSGESDATALTDHTGETGATWTQLNATHGVTAAGRAYNKAGGEIVSIASGSPASAEYDVEADLVGLTATSSQVGVAGRCTDKNNLYFFDAVQGTGLRLYKRVAITYTQLGSYSTTVDGSYAARLKLEIRDGAKKGYEAGVERISTADNALTAAGSAGIRSSGAQTTTTGIHLDNFTASDPAAGGETLVVADASHGHTADSPSLTQANALVVDDATHGHSADSPALTQANTLAVDDAAHGHTADSPALTPAVIAYTDLGLYGGPEAPHEFTAKAPAAPTLVVADASHGHTAESPSLTQANTLVVASATHAHAADSPALVVAGALAVQDAAHAHTADSPALTQAGTLVPADALHAHTADSPALTQDSTLAPQDALHGHSADEPTLSVAFVLVTFDALHAHLADGVSLTQAAMLAVQDALHAHTADNVVLPDAAPTLDELEPDNTWVAAGIAPWAAARINAWEAV